MTRVKVWSAALSAVALLAGAVCTPNSPPATPPKRLAEPQPLPASNNPVAANNGKVIMLFACEDHPDRPECHTTPCLATAEHHGDEWLLVVNRNPPEPEPKYAHGEFDAYIEVGFKQPNGEGDSEMVLIPAHYDSGTLIGRDWNSYPPFRARCRRYNQGPPRPWGDITPAHKGR
jgi:hypothetical protein